jgi:hypothetical protein
MTCISKLSISNSPVESSIIPAELGKTEELDESLLEKLNSAAGIGSFFRSKGRVISPLYLE